jgi:hypothetical protein
VRAVGNGKTTLRQWVTAISIQSWKPERKPKLFNSKIGKMVKDELEVMRERQRELRASMEIVKRPEEED